MHLHPAVVFTQTCINPALFPDWSLARSIYVFLSSPWPPVRVNWALPLPSVDLKTVVNGGPALGTDMW